MALRLLAYVPLLFLAAAVSAGLAVYTWRHRDAPGAKWLAGMLVGMTAWAGFYAVGLLTQSVDLRVQWLRLNWMGSGFVPMCWLLFALEYSGRTGWITRRTVGALATVPVMTVVLAWTTDVHNLMWSSMYVEDQGAVTILRYDAGLWYSVFDVYTYLVIGVATVVLVGLVLRHRDLYTDQAVALMAGAFFPAVGYAVVLLGFIREGVDITPLTFPVTGMLFGYVIFRGNLMEALSPTAAVGEDAAVETMQDGVVVVDDGGEIIEHNPAAKRLFGASVVGRHVDEVPGLDGLELDGREYTAERESPDNSTLEVTVTPIWDVHDRTIGHSLVVRDITERKMVREHLEVSNRVLRHNLRNELSIVVNSAELIGEEASDPLVDESVERIRDAATTLTESGQKARLPDGVLEGRRERKRVDFAALAREAVEDAQTAYQSATVNFDGPETAYGLANPDIERALTELVENAAIHAGESPIVDVSVTVDDDVRVTVSDDGSGVPEHERQVLTATRETALEHGSGVGLYLVRWLVEWSGGTLTFDGSAIQLRFDAATDE